MLFISPISRITAIIPITTKNTIVVNCGKAEHTNITSNPDTIFPRTTDIIVCQRLKPIATPTQVPDQTPVNGNGSATKRNIPNIFKMVFGIPQLYSLTNSVHTLIALPFRQEHHRACSYPLRYKNTTYLSSFRNHPFSYIMIYL